MMLCCREISVRLSVCHNPVFVSREHKHARRSRKQLLEQFSTHWYRALTWTEKLRVASLIYYSTRNRKQKIYKEEETKTKNAFLSVLGDTN